MKRFFLTNLRWLLASIVFGLNIAGSSLHAQEAYFSQLFTEKVLTVSRESDGIIPGSLRTVLIQASGIRSQNSFALVRIAFDPAVKRVRVTKGPLPEIDGSLTTLDCQTSAGRVLIEGAIEDTEGHDPSQEMAGLKVTSNGNTVRNCHITGFKGPGILLQGNRNLIEYNTLGYHKDSPETAVDASPLYGEPKTNQGAGLLINGGSNENVAQNNEFIANTANGVQISSAAGTGNRIVFNVFSKNSGKAIKGIDAASSAAKPQITKVSRQGDDYLIEGVAEANSELQVYVGGKEEGEVGMNVISGARSAGDRFTLITKSKGFVPNQTRLVMLAHGANRNTSEFSSPMLVTQPGVTISPETETAAKPQVSATPRDEAEKPSAVETDEELDEGMDGAETDAEEHPPAPVKPAAPIRSAPVLATTIPAKPPTNPTGTETTLNIRGLGDKGGTPDSGAANPRQHEVSALGI